jgi:hypothetical protein
MHSCVGTPPPHVRMAVLRYLLIEPHTLWLRQCMRDGGVALLTDVLSDPVTVSHWMNLYRAELNVHAHNHGYVSHRHA